jgi:hypothetical protein
MSSEASSTIRSTNNITNVSIESTTNSPTITNNTKVNVDLMDENTGTESKTIEKKRFTVKRSDSLKEKSINIIHDDNNQENKTKVIRSVQSESCLNSNNGTPGILSSPIPCHHIGQNLLNSSTSFQNLSIETNTEYSSIDTIHFSSIGSDFKSNYAQPLNRSPTPTFSTTSVFSDGNIDSRNSSKSPPTSSPSPRSPSISNPPVPLTDVVGNSDVVLKKNRFSVKSITPSNSPSLNNLNLISNNNINNIVNNNNNNNKTPINLPLPTLPNQITVPTVQKTITPPASITPQQNEINIEINNNNSQIASIIENNTNQIQSPIQQVTTPVPVSSADNVLQSVTNQELNVVSPSILSERSDNLNETLRSAISTLEQSNSSINIPLKLKQINSSTSTVTPTNLSPSTQTNEYDNIGKLTYANNEIKKKLELSLKQNRDFQIETNLLRERCQMLEEKFKIQNSKSATLEEMFERGRVTQKKLLSHIDVQQNTIDLLQKQILTYQSDQSVLPTNYKSNSVDATSITNIDEVEKKDSAI